MPFIELHMTCPDLIYILWYYRQFCNLVNIQNQGAGCITAQIQVGLSYKTVKFLKPMWCVQWFDVSYVELIFWIMWGVIRVCGTFSYHLFFFIPWAKFMIKEILFIAHLWLAHLPCRERRARTKEYNLRCL